MIKLRLTFRHFLQLVNICAQQHLALIPNGQYILFETRIWNIEALRSTKGPSPPLFEICQLIHCYSFSFGGGLLIPWFDTKYLVASLEKQTIPL